jgi:hypothetical protein
MRFFFLLPLGLALLSPVVRAETYIVDPQGTGSFPTIQAAITACVPGDTILLTDGVFTGTGNRDIDYQGKGITIRSESGNADACVIDCQHLGRGFLFISREPLEAILQNITITNGTGQDGGGLLCRSSSNATLQGCVFRGNHVTRHGGAVACGYSSSVTATDCAFIGNSANANGYGGGVECYSECTLVLVRCLFSENSALYGGGVECWYQSVAKISYSTFVRNRATLGGGGGLDCVGGSLSLVQRSTFLENTAASLGSGISVMAFQGGGSTVRADNVIVAFGKGSSVYLGSNATIELVCCDVFGNAGGDWIDGIAGQMGINGNISQDPLFCGELNPLYPYTLYDGSPCAPEYNPLCGLIGAWPIGCGMQDVAAPLPGGQAGPASLSVSAFPNPFTTSTQIGFTIPAGEAGPIATLDVYDVTGRLVRNLLAGAQLSASGDMIWDARDSQGREVAAGTYFCRLAVGQGSIKEQLLVVR